MKPYYADDAVTIFHADCREVLPSLTADLVLTDPPYGTGFYESDNDVLTPDLMRSFLTFGPTCIFGWPENLVALCVTIGLIPDEWVVWWPTNAAAKCGRPKMLRKESEHIAIFGKGRPIRGRQYSAESIRMAHYAGAGARGKFTPHSEGALWGDVWRDASPGILGNSHLRLHPNEKPPHVFSRLISMFEAAVVLDPFAGSGASLLAAKDLGRKAIGIEIEERYCEIAAKRMSQAVLQFGRTG